MAFITAETRSSIVELAMGMLNQAPSTAMLETLIAKSVEGASTQDLADYIATTAAFTAEYPATQTAREFATEMFGKLITGGTLDAEINTAVIDLLEGLLTGGTTKAQGFVAVIDFLANPANAAHADLGDIAQSFQNRADAAEYFSITKELGGSTAAELAAAIASVTSDAATLTAANAASDSTASAGAVVAGQTFTLTTGVETISGGLNDETINAPATSGVTGAAATTLDSGDVIDGGAGTDTLNITMTATNNNSLAGVTVKNVEKVYVTGANFQTSGTTGAALVTATAAKAATAASLTAAQAADVTAQQQDNAANAVTILATSVVQAGVAGAKTGGLEGEDAVLSSASITVATAASNAAAAQAIAALTTAAAVTTASTATAIAPTGATAYSLAQYNAAALAALKAANGTALTADNDVVDRATILANTAETVKTAVDSTSQDLATAIQLSAAAAAVDALTTETAVAAASTATALPAGVTTFTLAQYKAAALASLSADTGAALDTGAGVDDSATITARAAALALEAGALVTYETNRGDFTLAQLNSAAGAALTSSTGATLQTNGDDSGTIKTRGDALDAITATVITAAAASTAKAVVADNTAASALAVATAAAAAVADASLSGASFAGSEQVWLVGANSNKTDLTVTTQTAGLSGVTGLNNKVSFGATGTLAVISSTGTVDIGGAAGGLTIGGSGGTLTLTNTGGTTAATAVKALTISTTGAMAADVAGLTQLTTVTSNGAGGATVSGSGIKLATIATGDGADSVKIGTTTVKDNTTTAIDETVSADVSTGAGNDTVNIGTTGAGTTTVATGEGNDTVYVRGISTGVGTITTGAGNDTVDQSATTATLAANPNMTINAGDGVDSLITVGGTLTAVDYLRMNTALSGFETVTFTGDTVLDVSELSIGSIAALTFTNAGKSTVTKVGATALVTAPLLAVTASTNGITPARDLETGTLYLDATAAGYTAGVLNTSAPVYAGALNITYAAFGGTTVAGGVGTATATGRVEADAASATITVVSTGGATAAASNAAKVTLGAFAGLAIGDSDLNSLVVNLSSARGTAAATAATEYLAEFDAGTVVNTAAGTYDEHLEALSSLKVNGTGTFTIDTGSVSKLLAKLTTIDVSGMIAMANLDATGLQADTTNRSTSSITLNDNVSETVLLGGARDTVATDSTVAAMDTITGFQLTASAASALVADTTRSDVLNLTTATAFTKFTSTSASTFAGILSEAGAAAVGGVAKDNLVFHFGGDTYVYVDTGANGLTDNDVLVKLTGTLDLDQMITAGVIA